MGASPESLGQAVASLVSTGMNDLLVESYDGSVLRGMKLGGVDPEDSKDSKDWALLYLPNQESTSFLLREGASFLVQDLLESGSQLVLSL